MKSNPKTKTKRSYLRDHYHWIVAATVLFMIFVHGGVGNNLQSLHLIPITEYLSISRAEFSLAFSAQTITGALSTFLSGFLISRFGCRIPATVGLLTAGIGYLILANIKAYPALIVSGTLLGLTAGFCSTSGAALIVRAWFHRHAGTVLGLVTAASGIGASVMAFLQTAAMESGSFRSSFKVAADSLFLAAILFFVLVRNKPEDKGLVPLGDGEEVVGKRRRIADRAFAGASMKELWTRPAFYLMLLATLLSCFGLYMVLSILRSHFVDVGFSPTRASALYSTMMLFLTASKFLVGFFSDKIGARKVNLFCLLCAATSLALFALTSSFGMATLAVFIYAAALPTVTILTPLVAYSLFGYRAQAQYTGIFLAIVSVSNFFGNYVTNFLHDRFHSYRPSFWISFGIALFCFALFLLIYRLADRDRALQEDADSTSND